MTDLILAIGHHLLMFTLVAVLVMELMLVRPGVAGGRIDYVGRLDLAYGLIAAAIVIVGIGRVLLGVKGWPYYVTNLFFWAKMGAFLAVGLLSVPPTLRIRDWRQAVATDTAFTPSHDDIGSVRRFMHWEAVAFAFIPVFAALMARGYGAF